LRGVEFQNKTDEYPQKEFSSEE